MNEPIIEERPIPWRLATITPPTLKERLDLKDALACEMEIRAGDLAYETEADLVFRAAREYLAIISG